MYFNYKTTVNLNRPDYYPTIEIPELACLKNKNKFSKKDLKNYIKFCFDVFEAEKKDTQAILKYTAGTPLYKWFTYQFYYEILKKNYDNWKSLNVHEHIGFLAPKDKKRFNYYAKRMKPIVNKIQTERLLKNK
jgi:hypothetical protein